MQEPRAHNHRRAHKARSIPHSFRKPYFRSAAFALLHYLFLIGTISGAVLLFPDFQPDACLALLGLCGLTVFTGIIAHFARRSARCPLCQGSPLLNSGALAHRNSYHLPLLSHGTTATLSLLATRRFQCMYCGARYDLFKPLS